MNRTILIGRITKDLELKTTQSNIPVVTFTLAVDKQFKDDSGERGADFIQCVTWRKTAENLVKYCGKGSLIAVDGRISTRDYDTDNGKRYVTEVVADDIQFLDSKKEEEPKQDYIKQGKVKVENIPTPPPSDDLPF